jgi:hypothetical protein
MVNYLNNNQSGTYGWVFGQIRIDPHESETIYILGVPLSRSTDGGKTFASFAQGVHGDHHGMWIDPANTNIIYNSNDGGFYQTSDGGKSWKFAVAAGGSQFYNVELDTSTPMWAYGSIQDIGSRRGQIQIPEPGSKTGTHCIPAAAWEGAPAARVQPRGGPHQPEHRLFARFLRRFHPHRSGRRRSRRAGPRKRHADSSRRPYGGAARAVDGAVHHLAARQHDCLCGFQTLFKSKNRGDAWETISHDLSDNNSAQMGQNPSAIPYQTIIAVAESPKKKDLLYVGTDDGRLHTTIDGGKEWTELTTKLPVRRWISRVTPSAYAEGTVYVTQRGREDDDFAAYVYKSTDFGKTFQSIVNNIPAGPVNVIREDPETRTCCMWARTSAYSSPPTAARGGRCSAATCHRCRCPICSSARATTSS